MTSISSCHWKIVVPFCLRKKRRENVLLTLIFSNRTEKQIIPSKTTINWLFNDIGYLFIACFDGKIGVFQQTVVIVYYILNTFR